MHIGRPCADTPDAEYFQDGITNGAQWYSVSGLVCYLSHIDFKLAFKFLCQFSLNASSSFINNSCVRDDFDNYYSCNIINYLKHIVTSEFDLRLHCF